MTATKLALSALHVQNFKAVRDTGVLQFGGFTAFIGDNGAGKSSVLEALRFMADLSRDTLDEALLPFRGFEHVRWKGGVQRGAKPGRTMGGSDLREFYPIKLTARGHIGRVRVTATTRVSGQNNNQVAFENEELAVGNERFVRDPGLDLSLRANRSILAKTTWFDEWQFLDMAPGTMGSPTPFTQSSGRVRLARDGGNLARYLVDLRMQKDVGINAFERLLETLKIILPYTEDLETVTSEALSREVGLRLVEGSFSIPGWMLSTGTLRLIGLLALLRHPRPPSLICIEEIENGLDPRTINLIIDEIRRATDSGRTQVIVTTHSPYLLDLLELDNLVLVAREPGQPPRFDRPGARADVVEWAKRFAPGRLYTMGTFHQPGGPR